MKNLKDISKLLADRINQEHYVYSWLRKVFDLGLNKGFDISNTWISVNDRLPSHKDLVLVCIEELKITSIPAIFYKNNSFNGFYKFTSFYGAWGYRMYKKVGLKEKHKMGNVTHWMPLPNPPAI